MINNEYEVLKKAATILDKKKALDIVAIDVEELTIISKYFLIASGGSSTQVKALADEIREKMGENVVQVEGKDASGWIIIDLGGVMVHIFSRQMRDFYALEHLWEGAKRIDIKDLVTEEGVGEK